jgi:hypothetical protein
MDGTGKHHSELNCPGSEDQKSHVLSHMQTLDLRQIQQCCGFGSHTKGREHTGGMGIGRKPKT